MPNSAPCRSSNVMRVFWRCRVAGYELEDGGESISELQTESRCRRLLHQLHDRPKCRSSQALQMSHQRWRCLSNRRLFTLWFRTAGKSNIKAYAFLRASERTGLRERSEQDGAKQANGPENPFPCFKQLRAFAQWDQATELNFWFSFHLRKDTFSVVNGRGFFFSLSLSFCTTI